METSKRSKSKELKSLFGQGRDFTRRVVEKVKGKGKYREEVNDHAVLEREDTISADILHIAKNPSTSSLGSTPSRPTSSQCYSEFEDISEQINNADLKELGLLETAPPTQSDTTLAQSDTSLGKRKASDVSDASEPIVSNKSRKTEPEVVDHSTFSDEEPVLIAYYPQLLGYFKNLRYGVAWEIARLLSLRNELPELTMEALESLMFSNAESAPKAIKVILGQNCDDASEVKAFKDAFAKEISAQSPWEELDREEEALHTDPFAGLGFKEDSPGWYGGRVQFSGRLKDISSTKIPKYTVVLDRPVLGPSCRFGRRFGSSNILKIKLPKTILNKSDNGLLEFFVRPFIIHTHVFRTFYAKDNNMFLFRTNETMTNSGVTTPAPSATSGPMSLMAFLNWHNPLEFNSKQAMTKWASRFSLGLSTSVPGLRLKSSDIIREDEIISAPPESSEMTDGCGMINRSALLSLRMKYEWNTFPTAIQCRLGGTKGVLCLHHSDAENMRERPCAWTRPSQTKIKYSPEDVPDPAMLIIDVLQSSHMRSRISLCAETIINLAANGVPHEVFVRLLRDGLEEQVADLIQWEGQDAMFDLWCAVSRVGGVMAARMAREVSGEAKARGYRQREAEDLEPDDEDGLAEPDITHQRSSAWWADQISGCPSSLEETVMVLLDSGFRPQDSNILREKLHAIIRKSIDNYVLRYRINVPMSCSALIVPDTRGVLAPHEVHIKSSHRDFKTRDGMDTDIIIGDVLITRNPCKVATDVQKAKAVFKPELADLVDVIVCPISGYRRFAELLAGGDYDGDKGVVFYDPNIVDNFRNADEKYSREPQGLADNFSRNTETVSDVLQRIHQESPDIQLRELQKFLLGPIQGASIVGKYSSFHDYAIYMLGYTHPDTVRLSYMFCAVLDAIKTGRAVLPEVVRADSSKFHRRHPLWKETKEDAERLHMVESNEANPTRPSHLGPFIMDVIYRQAKKAGDLKRAQVEKLFLAVNRLDEDPDLVAPWRSAESTAARAETKHGICKLKKDLEVIRTHVRGVYKGHKARMKKVVDENGKIKRRNKEKGAGFTDLPIEVRQDVLRASAKEFASKPLPEDVLFSEAEIATLRASYAYIYDRDQETKGWSRFPWDVAMRELCTIKARALGPTKTVTENFYARYYMKHSSPR